MHFDTYVPSSGVNNEKLVRAENSQTHKYILKVSMNYKQPTIPQSSPGTADIFSLLKLPTIVRLSMAPFTTSRIKLGIIRIILYTYMCTYLLLNFTCLGASF